MKLKKIIYFLLTNFPNLKIIRWLVTLEKPKFLIQLFINLYFIKILKINLTEVEHPVNYYNSFLSFFTRKLAANSRPITPGSKTIISPVDAQIIEYGNLENNKLIQVKKKYYKLEDLVGSELTSFFYGGKFITLYLSPKDYHRIHHPFGGSIQKIYFFPGKLYPVNLFSLNNFNSIFSKNKRVIINYKNKNFNFVSCWIGALNVGEIKIFFDDSFYKTAKKNYDFSIHQKYFSKSYNFNISKGQEAGCFELGSTVILLFEPNKINFTFKSKFIRLGQELGQKI